jgi:hypothetical protein
MTIKDTLNAEITSDLASGKTGGITAAQLRQDMKDIVAALPVPAGSAGDLQTNDGAGGLAALSRSGGLSTDYLARDNTYKTVPAGGGGGTPGGSDGQVQYNNSGVFAGFTLGGDATLTPSTGAIHVTKTNGVSFSALATASAVALGSQVSGVLPIANGGTGTTTPGMLAGTNISLSGSWPNQTINASGGGVAALADTRALAITTNYPSVGSGGPTYIRTAGYSDPSDGGGDTYVRVSSTPTYSNLIWFQSADGQKWSRVNKNEPYKLEQAGGGTGASGAANNAAVEAINSIFTSNKFGTGYGFAGAQFQLGYGTYNFAGPWFVKGGCKIEGMGSAFYGGYATTLQFPAGSDGFVLGAAGSNGRLYNPSIYGDFDGRSTVIRDMYIRGGWNGGTRYLDDRTTGMRGIGVLSKAPIFMTDVVVGRFAEFGVYIKGTAGGGGSATEPAFGTAGNDDPSESYVAVHGYANSFMLFHVNCDENGVDGFRIRGADANAGSIIGCSATLNCGWGYNDLCFLGNWYWGNHAASNGIRDEHDFNSGKQFGAYQCYGDSQYTTFIANYSEGDYPGRNSYFTGYMNIIGGLMAGGYHTTPSGIIFNQGTGGLYISQHHTPTLGGTLTWGAGNVDGETCNLDGDVFWRKAFNRYDQGTFGVPDLLTQTVSGYGAAQGRSSTIGAGNILFGHGFWLGGPQTNAGFDLRFTGMSDGLPTAGKWARGDFVRMVNPSAGGAWAYVCTSGGDYAGTAPVWKSVGNLAS